MMMALKVTELVYSITEVIDLISPQVAGHHSLTAYVSLALGKQLGLSNKELAELEIAASLHDIGALTLQERIEPLEFDYKDSNNHALKGYTLLSRFRPFANVAKIVKYHHKSAADYIDRMNTDRTLFSSNILCLADRVAVLTNVKEVNILAEVEKVVDAISQFKGTLLHDNIVEAFQKIAKKESFWFGMKYLDKPSYLNNASFVDFLNIKESDFEDFIVLISMIVDFKSRFTAAHSSMIATCGEIVSKIVGFSEQEQKQMRYAGYLHDLGKLSIPTEILEKPGALSREEFSLMKSHTYHTDRVLKKISGFDTIRIWGALHHEALNGCGYPFGLKDSQIPLGARIMAVADIFTAIREDRPYRESMSKERTFVVLNDMANTDRIDKKIVNIIVDHYDLIDKVRAEAYHNAINQYEKFSKSLGTVND